MGQDRLTNGIRIKGNYDYSIADTRSLIEDDFIGYKDLHAATEGVLKVLSDSIVDTTPVTTGGYEEYTIIDVNAIDEKRKVRPVNTELFISDVEEFNQTANEFKAFLSELASEQGITESTSDQHSKFLDENGINEVLYTMAQGVGIGLDALSSNKNKARKHAGLRFESVVEKVVDELNIENDNHLFRLPIPESNDTYRCEIDMILSPHEDIQSTKTALNPDETVVSIKTTSKDRMTKVFTDKMLMSQFLNQDVQLLGLFLNDIQRKEESGVSSTFVANNYYIYYEHLTPLEGTYFIDPPSKINEAGYQDKLSTFKQLILEDIWDYC